MAKTTRTRLSPDTPIIKEYQIFEANDYLDKESQQNISVAKFVKPYNEGTRESPKWVDRVYKEFVQNDTKIDLKWMKIRVTTEIVY